MFLKMIFILDYFYFNEYGRGKEIYFVVVNYYFI